MFRSGLTLFYLHILFALCNGQPCDPSISVDLSGGMVYNDGTIVKDSVIYPPYYVYERNVNGDIKHFGCVCKIRSCLRKCCPLGSVMWNRTCSVSTEDDIIFNRGIDVSFKSTFSETVDVNSSFFNLVIGRPSNVYLEPLPWYVQKDGKLFVETPYGVSPWTAHEPDQYCIDTFVHDEPNGTRTRKLNALVCFSTQEVPESNRILSSSCMMVSCVFIIATICVYLLLPELRNLHGRVLVAYLSCLFVAFLLLGIMQILLLLRRIDQRTCLGLTFTIYFSLISAFSWLNVMSFDIWWTFSGNHVQSSRANSRFMKYAIYSFGIATVLTILLVSLEFSGLPPNPWLPLLRVRGCFIHGESRLVYLYGPMMVLCVANMTFFLRTAYKIILIDRQTKVLKSKESSTHDQHKNDRQRLLLYVKLFVVMGVSWLMEVFSAFYPEIQEIWNFTDTYNVLIGVTIFIMFVCKKKIFRLLRKRIKECFSSRKNQEEEIKYFKNKQINKIQKERTDSLDTVQSSTRCTYESISDNRHFANHFKPRRHQDEFH